MADMHSRRTLFLRVAPAKNKLGLQTVQLDANTRVVYNGHPNTPLYIDACAQQADTHHGKVIIPFMAHMSTKSMDYASHFIIMNTKDNSYVFGDIAGIGKHWTRKSIDETLYKDTEYAAPAVIAEPSTNCWVALRDTVHGTDLDLSDWLSDTWEGDRQLYLPEIFDSESPNYSAANYTNAYVPEGGPHARA